MTADQSFVLHNFLCFDLTNKNFVTSSYPSIDISFGYHFARFVGKIYGFINKKSDLKIDFNECKTWCKSRRLPCDILNQHFLFNSYFLMYFQKQYFKKFIIKHKLKICFVECWQIFLKWSYFS